MTSTVTADHILRWPRVSRPVAFWLVAYAFAVIMFGTTLPSPLYRGYEIRFGFDTLMVTIIYAVYASGVLVALLLFGGTSDTFGRKRVMLPALAVAALSSALFLAVGALHSGGIALLVAARVLSGISAGMFIGTATAALADLGTAGQCPRAALLAALANLGGTGLGPLVAGIFTRWVALPLQTVFILHLVLITVAAAAISASPETAQVAGRFRLRLQRLKVPADVHSEFAPAAAAGFAGFAVSGLFVAVTPSFLAVLGHHNPALTGLVVSAMFAAAVAGMVISAVVARRAALLSGTGLLIVGLVVIALALAVRSLPLLACGALIAGASQGLGFRAALESVTLASPPEQRSAISSSFFAICYVGGISLPVIGVGFAAQHFGLVHTAEAFIGLVAVIASAALLTLARHPSRPSEQIAGTVVCQPVPGNT